MKATGNFDKVKDVDPMQVLAAETRAHIDHWAAKFPPDRKRSALIQGLMAAQEQNQGHLTDELIAATAKYLDLQPVWAYEVATFYSMFETEPVGRHNVAVYQHFLLAQWRRRHRAALRKEVGREAGREHRRRPRLPQEGRGVLGRVLRGAGDGGRRPLPRETHAREAR